MPSILLGNWSCHYRIDGADDRPVLILAHSLGLDLFQWDMQVADFLPHFKIIRYDLRGHGLSGSPAGDYSIEQLGRDAIALADALQIRRFAFCGVSLGGMIGLWLSIHAPDRLSRVVVAATTAHTTEPSFMEERRRMVLEHGMASIVDSAIGRFFPSKLLVEGPPCVAAARRALLATDPIGYAGCCAAIRDLNLTADLSRAAVPILVVAAQVDVVFPWETHGSVLATKLPDVRVVHLQAAHLPNIETPRSFNAAVFDFLLDRPDDLWTSGLEARGALLGRDHVERALASATDFTRDFQELITAYAWGSIWTRPGLDHRTRRLLVIAMTVALGRWEEFRLHLRAGLARELEWCDVKEVLLQAAIYAGVPAANTAFHLAAEEKASLEAAKSLNDR